MPHACALALDNVARIPKYRFEEVCVALRYATDC